jgi:hypothetical protein
MLIHMFHASLVLRFLKFYPSSLDNTLSMSVKRFKSSRLLGNVKEIIIRCRKVDFLLFGDSFSIIRNNINY